MKIYLHWIGETLSEVAIDEKGKVTAHILPFSSVENAILARGRHELYGSNPPFGLMEKFQNIPLNYVPIHRNPAVFFLTFHLANAEQPNFLSVKIADHDKIEVDDAYVTLPSLACSCGNTNIVSPCRHVIAVAHAIPHTTYIKMLECHLKGEKFPLSSEIFQQVEEGKGKGVGVGKSVGKGIPSISARFWDCERLGCYLQRRCPHLEHVEEMIYEIRKARPAFFNLDGAALVNDIPVIIEWKVSYEYPKGQHVLFKELSKRGVFVFVVVGDPTTLEVSHVRIYEDGRATEFIEMSLKELVRKIVDKCEGRK